MPPVIAAGMAIYAGVGAAGFAIGGAIGAAALQGALIGAIIGAASAAVTGGDIGKGMLYGALTGAVTAGVMQGMAGPGSTGAVTNAANAKQGVMATMSDTYKQAMIDMGGQAASGGASQVTAQIQPTPSQVPSVSGTAPPPAPVLSGPGVYSGTPGDIAAKSFENAVLPGQVAPAPILQQPSVLATPPSVTVPSGAGAGAAPPAGVDPNVWAQIQANKDNTALLAASSKKQMIGEVLAGAATPVVASLLQDDPVDDFEARRPQHSGSTYISRTGRNTDKYKRVAG